jgi:4-amino-4-deoxy-L-arabinose transferase-like glycosyltransferase
MYLLIPFQALAGMSVLTTRVPVAVTGILSVPLIYYIGARMFGKTVGLIAAAMLVVNPWHFASTRWAIDGSIVPFFVFAAVAAMLRAGLPIADDGPRPASPWLALVAGLVAGVSCYGYWAIRLHLPVFLGLTALLNARGWWAWMRGRAGAVTLLMFAAGLACTFGPLALRHLTDPGILARGAQTRLWEVGTPALEIARRIGERYLLHFDPDFLFVRGDVDPGNSPADSGLFEWTVLPLMLVGLVSTLHRFPRYASSALLLAMVVAYPVGDVMAAYPGAHSFRSSPGLLGLVLLAAWGCVATIRFVRRWGRATAWGTAALIAGGMLLQDVRSIAVYFTEWPNRMPIYRTFQADLLQACAWVRPRFDDVDAVIWTTADLNMPFAVTLVGLDYAPARWFQDQKVVIRGAGMWDYYLRYGKNYFLYGQRSRPYVEALRHHGRPVHALFVVRPNELGLTDPVQVIRDPFGHDRLWICDTTMDPE